LDFQQTIKLYNIDHVPYDLKDIGNAWPYAVPSTSMASYNANKTSRKCRKPFTIR
jgi:hypothetical protein